MKKMKKERLDFQLFGTVPPGTSVKFVFLFLFLVSAHCNTCCWTKIKGGEAGQVSLSVPVALPVPCHLGDS